MYDDYSDFPDGAASLTLGTVKSGRIDIVDDVDFFQVLLLEGMRYHFQLTPLNDEDGSLYLRLCDDSGAAFTSDYEEFTYIPRESGL